MTIDDVDAMVAMEAAACDERFLVYQPALVAELRRAGVREGEMRPALAAAHGEYWIERTRLLARYRHLLLAQRA